MPNLVVIAGPNGAGKSTAAPLLIGKRLGIAEFVNADVIASGLCAYSPEPEDVIRRRYARGLENFLELYIPIADSWALYDNSSKAKLVAKRELDELEEIHDAEAWRMIEKQSKAREHERAYKTGARTGGIMGVPVDEVTESLREAGRDAWRRHKALGYPIVIMRDGKVVVVPPEQIEI